MRVRVKRKVRAMVWVKDRGKVWVDIRRRKDVRVCVWIMIEEMKKAKKERDEQCRWLLRTWTSDKFIIYFYHNKNKVYYYPSLSYPIVSYPILFSPILFYPLLSYPILSYPIKETFSNNGKVCSYELKVTTSYDQYDLQYIRRRIPFKR